MKKDAIQNKDLKYLHEVRINRQERINALMTMHINCILRIVSLTSN